MHNVLFSSIVVAWLSACGATNVCAAEPVTAGRVLGQVAGADGAPVSGAVVYLSGHGAGRQTTTDARGRFVLTDVATGTYELAVDARGYNHLGERAVDVRARESPLLSLVLERASATLVTIGRVRNPDAQTISTSAVPSVVLDTQRFGAQGYANVADIIAQNSISTTVIRPNGAGAGAPAVVALRGPDPTETLVQIDGHSVTSGHTGSYDLSLLDPADLSSVQLVYGIAPTSLVGPNTIDGAVNVRTLGPTTQPHGLLRVSGGSFGTFGETLQATGTASSIGYAFSLHRATSQGEVRDTNLTAADGSATTVNGALAATTALGKLHYDFDRGAGFVELAFHDQSASRDLSAALTSLSSDGYAPSAGSSLSAHDAAYTVDLRAPLGVPRADGVAQTSVLYSHGSSLANQSVFGPAAGSSPYLSATSTAWATTPSSSIRSLEGVRCPPSSSCGPKRFSHRSRRSRISSINRFGDASSLPATRARPRQTTDKRRRCSRRRSAPSSCAMRANRLHSFIIRSRHIIATSAVSERASIRARASSGRRPRAAPCAHRSGRRFKRRN